MRPISESAKPSLIRFFSDLEADGVDYRVFGSLAKKAYLQQPIFPINDVDLVVATKDVPRTEKIVKKYKFPEKANPPLNIGYRLASRTIKIGPETVTVSAHGQEATFPKDIFNGVFVSAEGVDFRALSPQIAILISNLMIMRPKDFKSARMILRNLAQNGESFDHALRKNSDLLRLREFSRIANRQQFRGFCDHSLFTIQAHLPDRASDLMTHCFFMGLSVVQPRKVAPSFQH